MLSDDNHIIFSVYIRIDRNLFFSISIPIIITRKDETYHKDP